MRSDEWNADSVAQRRAAAKVDRIIDGQRRAAALVESLGRDGSGAALLAAMIPPPHDPGQLEAMRSGPDRLSVDRADSSADAIEDQDSDFSKTRWVSEGGALTDGPPQPP